MPLWLPNTGWDNLYVSLLGTKMLQMRQVTLLERIPRSRVGAVTDPRVLMRQDFEPPSGELLKAIESNFGSLDNMISTFNPTTAAVQARAALAGAKLASTSGRSEVIAFCKVMRPGSVWLSL